MPGRHHRVHEAAPAAKHIDGREMIALCKFVRQEDVAVEKRLDFLGDRIECAIALQKNAVEACDGTDSTRSGALEQTRQDREQRRGKAAARRRLAGSQANLALRTGKPRYVVHRQKHMLALVAEIFGNAGGHEGRLDALDGGAVGCRDDDDCPRQSLSPKLMLDEFAHLTPAFANQCNHGDIRVGTGDNVAKQNRFANARLPEDADALSARTGEQPIEGADSELDRLGNQTAFERRRRIGVDRIAAGDAIRRKWLAIQWLAKRADHATKKPGPDRYELVLPGRNHLGQARKARQVTERDQDCHLVHEADDFGLDCLACPGVQEVAYLADPNLLHCRVNDGAGHPPHTPSAGPADIVAQARPQFRNDGCEPVFYVCSGARHAGAPAFDRSAAAMASSCAPMPASMTAMSVDRMHASAASMSSPSISTVMPRSLSRRIACSSSRTLPTQAGCTRTSDIWRGGFQRWLARPPWRQ